MTELMFQICVYFMAEVPQKGNLSYKHRIPPHNTQCGVLAGEILKMPFSPELKCRRKKEMLGNIDILKYL